MANAQLHMSCYNSNKKFVKIAQNNGYHDWAVTVLFYSALHLIEAVFRKNKMSQFKKHVDRDDYIKKTLPIAVSTAYCTLKNESIRSRYECEIFDEDDLLVLQSDIKTIETYCKK